MFKAQVPNGKSNSVGIQLIHHNGAPKTSVLKSDLITL